jgi:hypothetical protein
MRINVLGVSVPEGGSPNIELAPNQEVCLDAEGHSVGSSSPNCKMDLYLEELAKIGSLYEVKIITGCY